MVFFLIQMCSKKLLLEIWAIVVKSLADLYLDPTSVFAGYMALGKLLDLSKPQLVMCITLFLL